MSDLDKLENAVWRLLAELDHLRASNMKLLAALEPFSRQAVSEDAPCHAGLVSMKNCCRCGPILRARAAIAEAKGDKT